MKIGLLTVICGPGIVKWIRISQFLFQKFQWRWSGHIVWKFGELWSGNSGFTRVVGHTPSSISRGVSLATFSWRHHCWALQRSLVTYVGWCVLSFVSLL